LPSYSSSKARLTKRRRQYFSMASEQAVIRVCKIALAVALSL